jgi:hypothetical protein
VGTVEQRLVGARDADRDGLGLVLDRVDRTGELLDRAGERGGEVLDQQRRRATLPKLRLVGLERHDAERVAQQRDEPGGGAGLERAVVFAGRAAAREERLGGGRQAGAARERAGRRVVRTCRRRQRSSIAARASRSGARGVDGQRAS